MRKIKKFNLLISLAFAILTLFVFTGCSREDEIPTTGTIRLEITNWTQNFQRIETLKICLAEHKDICVKELEFGTSKTIDVVLNPGNYYISLSGYYIDEGSSCVQVQAGKTEIIKIKKYKEI